MKLASLRTRVTVAICVERKSSKGKKRDSIYYTLYAHNEISAAPYKRDSMIMIVPKEHP